MNWLGNNWLALLGATTGTVALLINFLGFRHNLQKDKIQLSVSFAKHPNHEQNLAELADTSKTNPWDQAGLAPVFIVTVRNLGNVTAPIEDVGLIVGSAKRRPALVGGKLSNINILEKVTGKSVEPLPPLSSREFNVYLNRGEPLYRVAKAYVVDQTGKTWHSAA